MDVLLDLPVAAAVLDLDGVLTLTRDLHARAWTALFQEELPRLAPDAAPFAPADYERWVDGRSREDSIRTFLASRGIDGERAPAALVARLAERKQRLFQDLLEGSDSIPLVPGTVPFLTALRAAGIRIAVATASRNAQAILDRTPFRPFLDAVVDSEVARELGMASKPDPALFLEACRRLGVHAGDALLVEDSEAGVGAARAGGFGLVVGIAPTGRRSRTWSTRGWRPGATAAGRGSSWSGRCRATSPTSRAGRRSTASTWRRWPVRSTC